MSHPDATLADFHSAFVAALGAVHTYVYDDLAPATAVPTDGTPYAVVEASPGGGPAGSAFDQRQLHQAAVRVRAVAVDPTTDGTGAGAARYSAQFLAAKLRDKLLDVTFTLDGATWHVAGRSWVSTSGVMREGQTVNVVDDYLLTLS